MKFLIRGLLITAALAFLSSCGAGGAKFSGLEKPAKDTAQVYFYRPSSFLQSGNYPNIIINDKKIGELKTGGYLKVVLPEGEHTAWFTGDNVFTWIHKKRGVKLNLEKGKTYFYKLSITGQYSYSIKPVTDKEAALKDLQKLKESI